MKYDTKPFRLPTGKWAIDFRRSRAGEKPFRCARTFDTKSEAESYLSRLVEQVEEAAKLGLNMPTDLTLSEALDEWWAEAENTVAPSNMNATRNRKLMWQRSNLAGLPVRDITRANIKSWIAGREAQGRAGSTIRNDLQIVESLYSWLQDELEWYVESPIKRLRKKLDSSQERDRRLEQNELESISRAFQAIRQAYLNRDPSKDKHPGHTLQVELENGSILELGPTENFLYVGAAFQASIECAMRQGRLFAIKWLDIDFNQRVIKVADTGPRNKKVPATVPMSPPLVNVLKELHGPAPRIGLALDEPVFGPLKGERAYRYLQQVCKALGIEDFTWHDLRHEACSRLAELGWTTTQIQRVSGHRSLQSLKRYVHIRAESILHLFDNPPIQQQRTGT